MSIPYLFRPWSRLLSLLVVLLLGLAGRSQAQVYYLTSDGVAATTSAADALNRLDTSNGAMTTLLSSFTTSPVLLAIDRAGNRAFVYEGLAASRTIKVYTNLSTTPTQASYTLPVPAQVAAIEYDAASDYVYFLTTDANASTLTTTDALNRIKADGSGSNEVIISSVANSPSYLALNLAGNQAYVYEGLTASRGIKIVNLTATPGPGTGSLGATIAVPALVVALDYAPSNGYIYYLTSDGSGTSGAATATDAVYRTLPDGTNNNPVIASVTNAPAFMTLDLPNNRIYVADNFSNGTTINTRGFKVVQTTSGTSGTVTATYAQATFFTAIELGQAASPTTVSSITTSTSSPTNASSISYTVTFAASVTGLTASNFSLTPTGSVAGASISSVSAGPSATYTVVVNTGNGNGTLQLNLANSTGLTPTVSNVPFSGPTITLDKTAPTVTSVSVPASGTYRTGQTLSFTVNFSEAVTVTGTPQLGLTFDSGGVLANYASGSGTSALVFTYPIVAGNSDTNGIGVGTLGLNGGTIQDAAANNATLTLNSVGSTASVFVDGVAPTVASVNRQTPVANFTNATTLVFRVTFSEAVTGVSTSAFSLATSGTSGTIAFVTSFSTSVYDVTVSSASGNGTLGLNVKSSGTGITDGAGNALNGGFTGQTYTLDQTAPTVTAFTSSNGTTGSTTATTPLSFSVTFSESVAGFSAAGITVTNGTVASGPTGSGSGPYTFTVTPTTSGTATTVTIAANAAQDAAGNGNTASSAYSLTYQQPVVATSRTVTVQLDASGNGTLQANSGTTGVNNGSTGAGTLTYTIQKIALGRVSENSTLTLSTANGANFTAIRFASYGTPSDDGNGNYRKGSCDANGQNGTASSTIKAQNAFVGQASGSLLASNNYSDGSTNFGDPCSGTPKYLAVQAAYSADAASLPYACSEVTASGVYRYVLLTVTDANGNSNTAVARVTVVAPPAISISNVNPSSALRGATVTVTGSNLSGIGSTVTVNGATATVSGLSASGFTFVVPNTATFGAGSLVVTAPCSQSVSTAFTVQQPQTPTPTLNTPVSGTTTNGTPIFSGSTVANASVILYLNGVASPTFPADGSGNFAVQYASPLASGTYTAYITAQASGQSVSNQSTTVTFTVDNTRPTPTVSTTSGSPTSTAPIPYTVTFSETVTGFNSGGVTVTNGTVNTFSGSGTTYNLTITPSGSGTVTVSVPANVAQDGVGNQNVASNSVSVQYNQPTTATPFLNAPGNSTFTNNPTPLYRGTAAANSAIAIYRNGVLTDTTFANGLGNFHKFSGAVLTDGAYSVYVTATTSGQATSANSNTNTFTVDTQRPSVSSITSSAGSSGSTTNTTPIPFTVTFSENVTGFVQGDLTVTNGTISGFSGSGTTYTFNVTPITAGTATTVNVAANVAQDAAGNGNTAAASAYSLTYSPPTATVTAVTGQTPSPTATAQVSYTVTFSAAVSGLGTGNFNLTTGGSVSGASVTSVSGSGTTYTVLVNTGTGDGTLRLNVNNSTGVTPTISNVPYTSGTTYTITKSFAAAPTLRIQAAGSASNNGDVTAFVDVVQVLNASNGSAVPNGLQNTSFESSNVAAGSFLKTADGVVAAPWSFTGLAGVTRTGSGFAPPTPPNGDAVALVQSAGDNNASISQNLAVPTGSYQINFQTAQRNYTSRDQRLNVFVNNVFVGTIQPVVYTSYEPFTSATFTVTAPSLTATVSTTSGSPTSTSPIPFSVSFSQSVGATFTASDVTVTGGTLNGGSFSGSGSGPYTFTVTPSGAGTVTVSLAAGVANDANNTQNTASNSVSVQFQAPTITVTPATLADGTQGTAYSSVTFSATGGSGTYTYAISGTPPPGLSLTGNTLSGTPTTSGTFNFRITATDNSAAPGPYSGFRDYTVTIAPPAVTSVSWNGSISQDWFTAANWTPSQVPDATIDAVVPTAPSGNRFPLIDANAAQATAKNVSIATGASLSMSANTLTIAANLTNNGVFNGYTGSGGTATGGTVVVGGSTLSLLNGGGVNSFWNLSVGTSGAQLNNTNATSVRRLLTLNGNFTAGSNPFVLVSDATATAMVVNNGSAVVTGNTTVQRYIATDVNPNLGYRHVSTAVSGRTVSNLTTASYSPIVNPAYNSSATPLTTRPFPTVYGYDQARLATTTNNLSAFDKGWFSPNATSDPLNVGQGYTVLISGGQTWNFTGSLNNGTYSLNLARNSGATAVNSGLALVGNPYPSPLDWSQVTAADRTNSVDGVIYVWRSTDPGNPYSGVYGTYNNGVGNISPVLPQGQGFFVRVTQGLTAGTLNIQNKHRPTSYAATTYRRETATTETRPLVRLSLQGVGSSDADDAFVYFENGATDAFDSPYDAEKLPNPSGLNLSTSLSATQRLAIDGRGVLGSSQKVVPLAVGVPAVGSYTLAAAQLLNLSGTPTYLRDLQTGAVIDLSVQPSYQFTVSNAAALITGRFELVFSPQAPLATAPAALAQQVGLYPNPATGSAFVELPAALGRQAVSAVLVDAVGREVRSVTLPAQGAVAHALDLHELPSGVYLLRLATSAGTIVKKLTVE